MLFLLTTAAGSALWASQLETSNENNTDNDNNNQNTTDTMDLPPGYDDDPA